EQEGKSQKSEVRVQKSEVKSEKQDTGNQKSVLKDQKRNSPVQTSDSRPHTSSPINKEAKKELQKQQRIFQQLEVQIAKLNTQKTELEAALVKPEIYSDKNKFLEAEASYKKAAEELSRLNLQYEKTFELIVSLEGN
ncbi:MAG: ABC transporter C-terminal domain-containing protein, partial [Chitinophagaceae bacterium]